MSERTPAQVCLRTLATWLGPVDAEFEIPAHYKLITGLALGYASDDYEASLLWTDEPPAYDQKFWDIGVTHTLHRRLSALVMTSTDLPCRSQLCAVAFGVGARPARGP